MEHIEWVCSLESKLFLVSICSIRIPSRNGDIPEKVELTKTGFDVDFNHLANIAKEIVEIITPSTSRQIPNKNRVPVFWHFSFSEENKKNELFSIFDL